MLVLKPRRSPLTKLCVWIALSVAAPVHAQLVTIELIPLPQASDIDETSTLPTPVTTYGLGQTFFVEIWAQTSASAGFATVSVDIEYPPLVLTGVAIYHTELFGLFVNGAIDDANGRVEDIAGAHFPE